MYVYVWVLFVCVVLFVVRCGVCCMQCVFRLLCVLVVCCVLLCIVGLDGLLCVSYYVVFSCCVLRCACVCLCV